VHKQEKQRIETEWTDMAKKTTERHVKEQADHTCKAANSDHLEKMKADHKRQASDLERREHDLHKQKELIKDARRDLEKRESRLHHHAKQADAAKTCTANSAKQVEGIKDHLKKYSNSKP